MNCSRCGNSNGFNSSYCTECGYPLKIEKFTEGEENKKYFIQSVVLILLTVIVVLLSNQVFSDMPIIKHDLIFYGILLFISFIFLFFDFRGFYKILRFTFKIKPFLLIITLAPFLSILVIIVSGFLIQWFNLGSINYFDIYRAVTPHSYFFGILFVAVMPAIIEEIMFRGLLFNYLLRFTRPKSVIMVTAILFSFVHFSFLAFLWLLPIGIILGYLRYRYRTIWYPVAFHMAYNASVFLMDSLQN